MAKDEKQKIEDLNFGVEKSMRYHSRMASRYEVIHKLTMFITILAGSASISTALSEFPQIYTAISGAIVAIIATFNLTYAPGLSASVHSRLRDKFSDLAIEIRTNDESQIDYGRWLKIRLQIEQGEPPIFWALEADCDNEVRRAWGKDSKVIAIDLWSKFTMYLLRHTKRSFLLKPNPNFVSNCQEI